MDAALARRELLKAGSAFGLLTLAGCAGPEAATDRIPGPSWNGPLTAVTNGDAIKRPPEQSTASGSSKSEQLLTPSNPPQNFPPTGVLPRSRWTTTALKRPGNVKPMNGVSFITVHHDGMNAFFGAAESDSISRMLAIQKSHKNRKSDTGEFWADIGYHYIIDRSGRVWEGRPIAYQGAHVHRGNEHNIGVMCLGNFTLQQPTKAQTDRLDQFIATLMREHQIAMRNVRTHLEWNPTECPGAELQAYMQNTRMRGGNLALALADAGASLLA